MRSKKDIALRRKKVIDFVKEVYELDDFVLLVLDPKDRNRIEHELSSVEAGRFILREFAIRMTSPVKPLFPPICLN